MFVTVTGFGSIWRQAIRKDQSDPRRFAPRGIFQYNRSSRRWADPDRPRIVGHVRFNGVGGFDPNHPLE